MPAEQSEATARILDRLAEETREAAAMLRGHEPASARTPNDPRVIRARELLAEHHEPLTMSPGDVRLLLERTRGRMAELLLVIDRGQVAR